MRSNPRTLVYLSMKVPAAYLATTAVQFYGLAF